MSKPEEGAPAWRVVSGPYRGEVALGHTKGEARAALKRRYGLPRLPAGTTLGRLEVTK